MEKSSDCDDGRDNKKKVAFRNENSNIKCSKSYSYLGKQQIY